MPRRLATDRMREIRQAERSHRRMQADVTREQAQRATTRHQLSRANITNPATRSVGSRIRERGTEAVLDTATPSSNSGLIMTTLFTFVGLILFYNVVTKADQFSGLVGSAGDFLHKLSSTAPLFQVKESHG